MPIVDHKNLPELPWRPKYRVWRIIDETEHVDCILHYGIIEPNGGAPLHAHQTDELIVVLEGSLQGVIGDTSGIINPDQTMVIPKGISHSFRAVGAKPAKILTFFPSKDGMKNTVYFEGKPPKIYNKESET